MKAENRLLPDATLEVERIRGMDAEVRYRAGAVKAPGMPMKGVALDLTLDRGLLTMHPVSFEMPQGKLTAQVRLDARPAVPQTDVDRSEEHTSELQSLMRISYAVFCLK